MGELYLDKHVAYIKSLDKKKDFDAVVMEHLRMSGAYWGLTALDIMGRLGDMNVDEIVSWILMCQDDCGSHLLKLQLKLFIT